MCCPLKTLQGCPLLRLPALLLALLAFSPSVRLSAEDFTGWRQIRVMRQPGDPRLLRGVDIDKDGRTELIVVNTRHARLDVYRWLPPGKRRQLAPLEHPNDLPMAPEFLREEIPLEDLPFDVLPRLVDGGKLLVLTGSPNKVLLLVSDDAGKWKTETSWNLLPGSFSGRDRRMLLREDEHGKPELLVSFEDGIQQLVLEPDARARWFEPREKVQRLDWWLADIDGDGDDDVVEWIRESDRSVRWYEVARQRLLPPQVLHEKPASAISALKRAQGRARLLLLGGQQEGLLRCYRLDQGEDTPLGRRQALSLPEGKSPAWCGVRMDGQPALAVTDPEHPRLLVNRLDETGWQPAESFPIVKDVQKLAAPRGSPGTLILWGKDSPDLHLSRWEHGRFSYPQPMGLSKEDSECRVLGLGDFAGVTWWIQRVGDDADLYLWPPDLPEARCVRFEGVGKKAEHALWIGGERILSLDQYARSPKLHTRRDGKVETTSPSHLKDAKLEEFRLFDVDGSRRLARINEGVLQWLGEDVRPEDQIMLSEGQRLVSYVPGSGGRAWALEAGGRFVHLLETDSSGVQRVHRSIRLPGGNSLHEDPVLGLLLETSNSVIRLSRGRPWELALLQTIDSREARTGGVREPTMDRIFVTDVTGSGEGQAVLTDDRRHQLTVMGAGEKEELETVISWPVFEDRAYPYGSETEELVTEPRAVLGLDLDGDDAQDLAMLSHDRLIVYLNANGD